MRFMRLNYHVPDGLYTAWNRGYLMIIFFPTYGYLDAEQARWNIHIHGWAFEPELDSVKRAALLGLLRRVLGLNKEDIERVRFKSRARAFLVTSSEDHQVTIRMGDRLFSLGPAAANGHFRQTIKIPETDMAGLLGGPAVADTWLHYSSTAEPECGGQVRLLHNSGVSVISDIDDTIKVTHATERLAMLASTFLHEYEAVPGMADVYRAWADQGVDFHYVSASPWQLFTPLQEFLRDSGFPEATMHLKPFRWKDSTLADFLRAPQGYKLGHIEPLLASLPNRRFILVGDSGQQDPEVYGTLARTFDRQVAHVFIRNVLGQERAAERFAEAFEGFDSARWSLFNEARELADSPALR